MMTTMILPGIGGSGEAHWQTIWQREDPRMVRFRPGSWDRPELDDWIRALDVAVDQSNGPAMLIAHSLACLLVAHWASRSARTARIAGAFLVAVPDPDGPVFPRREAGTFLDVPTVPLPFPALIVASSNDPYASLDHVEARAADWNAGLVEVGAHGHINGASGLGSWPEGARLLTAFRSGIRRADAPGG